MRILRTESSRNWGGQEERLLAEANWMIQRGHFVAIVCDPEAALLPRARELEIPCFPTRMRTSINPLATIALFGIIRKWKPDVVHTNSPKDSWLCYPLHVAGVPVVRSRNISLSHHMTWTRSFIYRYGCRRVIPTAEFIAERLRNESKVPADHIDVVGVGVDTKVFNPEIDGSAFRHELGIAESAPLFGVVAMLRGEKGQRIFLRSALEVLKTHPNYRFIMIGRGTGKGNIEQKLKEEILAAFPNGESPILLTGFRKDIPEAMAALTALVVPSIHDAQPLVIPQAFAMGRAVIGSRGGGIPELVRHEENGLLVEVRDEAGLTAAMLRLGEDQEFRKRLEKAAYEFCSRELSFDRKMEQLIASYTKALAN
ncbi:MAG: glycosyltransferase family 4 protein [Chthoniobacterales bacterium]